MKIPLLILSILLQGPAFPIGETGTIGGRIRSADGKPLSGIAVFAALGWVEDGNVRMIPLAVSIPGTTTTTDEEGRFSLQNIPRGRYYILAEPRLPSPNSAEIDVATLFPGVRGMDGATRVAVEPGIATNDIDFPVVRVRPLKVRGRLLDEIGGTSPAGAMISLTGFAASRRTTADGEGNFELTNVSPGVYALWAREKSPGMAFATRRIVVDAEMDGVELAFRPRVNLTGRASTEDGRPFSVRPGLQVGVTANIVERTHGTGTSIGMDGTFQMSSRSGSGLIAGEYRVTVDHLPDDYYVKSMSSGSVDLLRDTLRVSADPSDEVRIVLANGTRLTGNVVDDRVSRESETVRVYLLPQDRDQAKRHLVRIVTADHAGAFDIRAVAPGTYTIFAIAQPFAGVEMDPEFMREYGTRGSVISVAGEAKSGLIINLLR